METISRSLLTFLLNSLWQIPLAAAVAALACWFLRKGPASHRHAVWVASLAAAILLPLSSVRRAEPIDAPQFPDPLASPAGTTARPASKRAAPAPIAVSPAPPSRILSLTGTTATILLGAYLLFVLFRLSRLARALFHTIRVRQSAQVRKIPLQLDQVRRRCQEAFGVQGVALLFSAKLSGPVTAGRAIILPESLLTEPSEDVLTAAIGHEMAHLARRDFTCNMAYELLHLPISFHPAVWLIRRSIECTREMACDEMVTRRLLDAGVYARSIMSIATAMTALPRPGYTLGVFDGDILEERIRRLVERPAASLKRARLLLAGGLTALALCAVAASSLSFTARAQGAAGDMIKQGHAAYDRGDYKTAAGDFAAAVRLEPDNLEAKLLLAKSMAQQFTNQMDPANPTVIAAQKQYLDVLSLEPRNQRAIHGMMILTSDCKQYPEAYQWAQKAIQADAADATAYYTAGFLDWAMAFPDYMKARQAAGMKPQDPGIIPDAGLRQSVRTQRLNQIEDGHRMLQMALQLDPDYADAMAYTNLLYRIEAGIADTPAESAELTAKGDEWVVKALNAKRARTPNAGPADRADGPLWMPAPPPPPPPPPGQRVSAGFAAGMPQQRIRIKELQGMLLKQTPAVYPESASQAGITGTVSLNVVVGKDGKVQNVEVVSGPSALVGPAMEAVRQWVYQPVLLNGEPLEVTTTVSLTFPPQ